MKCAVYRFYDSEGTLVYVGISNNPFQRLYEHVRSSITRTVVDIKLQWCDSREEALAVEALAIRTESPLYNQKIEPMDYDVWVSWAFGNKVFPFDQPYEKQSIMDLLTQYKQSSMG